MNQAEEFRKILDRADQLIADEDRIVVNDQRGAVSLTIDSRRLIVGANPNDHPMNWSYAVIGGEQAAALRDWLAERFPRRVEAADDADGVDPDREKTDAQLTDVAQRAAADKRVLDAAGDLAEIERYRTPATEDSSIWLEACKAARVELLAAVDARRALDAQPEGCPNCGGAQHIPCGSAAAQPGEPASGEEARRG